MTHVLTFVTSGAGKPVSQKHFAEAEKIMGFYNLKPAGRPQWLAKNKAADLPLAGEPSGVLLTHLRDFLNADAIDLFVMPTGNRKKKLLVADMDSTIVIGETLDDLAEHAGLKDKIAAITALAMDGKLDFHAALKERVGLLKGLESTALEETLAKSILSPGAKTLVQTMKNSGAVCVLVSGGFTFFTGGIAQQVGFDHHHGNTLGVKDGKLTGAVEGPILDKHAKVDFLEHYMKQQGLTYDDCMTIGDGANDIPMLQKAGLGMGYQPKPVVEQSVTNFIKHGDLTAALYAQGHKGIF